MFASVVDTPHDKLKRKIHLANQPWLMGNICSLPGLVPKRHKPNDDSSKASISPEEETEDFKAPDFGIENAEFVSEALRLQLLSTQTLGDWQRWARNMIKLPQNLVVQNIYPGGPEHIQRFGNMWDLVPDEIPKFDCFKGSGRGPHRKNGPQVKRQFCGHCGFVGHCEHDREVLPAALHLLVGNNSDEASEALQTARMQTAHLVTTGFGSNISQLSLITHGDLMHRLTEFFHEAAHIGDVPNEAKPYPTLLSRIPYEGNGQCPYRDAERKDTEIQALHESCRNGLTFEKQAKYHGGKVLAPPAGLPQWQWVKDIIGSSEESHRKGWRCWTDCTPVNNGDYVTAAYTHLGSKLRVKNDLLPTTPSTSNRKPKCKYSEDSQIYKDGGRWAPFDTKSARVTCQQLPIVNATGACVLPPSLSSKCIWMHACVDTSVDFCFLPLGETTSAFCALSQGPVPHWITLEYHHYMDPWLESMRIYKEEALSLLLGMKSEDPPVPTTLRERLIEAGLHDPDNLHLRADMRDWADNHDVTQFEHTVSAVDVTKQIVPPCSTSCGVTQPPALFLHQIVLLQELCKLIEKTADNLHIDRSRLGFVPSHRIVHAYEWSLKWGIAMKSTDELAILLSAYEEADMPCVTNIQCIHDPSSSYWKLIPATYLESKPHFETLTALYRVSAAIEYTIADVVMHKGSHKHRKPLLQQMDAFFKEALDCEEAAEVEEVEEVENVKEEVEEVEEVENVKEEVENVKEEVKEIKKEAVTTFTVKTEPVTHQGADLLPCKPMPPREENVGMSRVQPARALKEQDTIRIDASKYAGWDEQRRKEEMDQLALSKMSKIEIFAHRTLLTNMCLGNPISMKLAEVFEKTFNQKVDYYGLDSPYAY